ncbi:MAG TPA: hypothetical protein VKT70_14245 [Stellaceae bacterium]|nr:hypothetical protein [Stellaceae bacterium]
MDWLIPTSMDLAGWAGVLIAALGLTGFGRLLTVGRQPPEIALVAGWGAASLLLTLWGVLTPASLRLLAWPLMAVGAAGLLWPGTRLTRGEWILLLKVGVLALPLLLIMASARASLPDTFLNLLPNFAYLYDHAGFPADDRVSAHSFIAGAPYNLQLFAFLASLMTPGLPLNALIAINVILQIAVSITFARLVAGLEEEERAGLSWGAAAAGLALVFFLNPGFAPRYHLSGYGETSVTVTLALAGLMAAQALKRMSEQRSADGSWWAMALILAALVNIKQDSIALVAGVIAGTAAVVLIDRGMKRGHAWGRIALQTVPALLLYLIWRWYVLSHFAVGELKPMPIAQWQIDRLPQILWSMAGVISLKGFLFAALALAFILVGWRLARRGFDAATRLGIILASVFIIYNLALVFAYVGHFPGKMGTDAHSYFRYITHLALLLTAVMVLLLREFFTRFAKYGFVPIALVLVAPVAFIGFFRFDHEVPQQRVWALAHDVAARIGDDERLALVLPGDNGAVADMLQGLLRMAPPRRPLIDTEVVAEPGADILAQMTAKGFHRILISCAIPTIPGLVPGEAALLAGDGTSWHVEATFPYASVPEGARWSQVLSDDPLCL